MEGPENYQVCPYLSKRGHVNEDKRQGEHFHSCK